MSLKLFANDSSLCSAVCDITTSISNLKARSFKNFRISSIVESSRPELFCKKGVLRNFTKSTGKHLCQSLFFNKVAGLRPATSNNTFLHRTPLVAASVLLKVQYRSSHFRIFWKALPLDYRPKGKRIRTYKKQSCGCVL